MLQLPWSLPSPEILIATNKQLSAGPVLVEQFLLPYIFQLYGKIGQSLNSLFNKSLKVLEDQSVCEVSGMKNQAYSGYL